MTNNNVLHLTGSELFSTQEADDGRVVDARFFVKANQLTASGVARQVYRLRVMTYQALQQWELEQRVEGESGRRDQYPMPVSDENLAGEPLDTYVQRVYLNPEDPIAVNDIRQFLEPADDDPIRPDFNFEQQAA